MLVSRIFYLLAAVLAAASPILTTASPVRPSLDSAHELLPRTDNSDPILTEMVLILQAFTSLFQNFDGQEDSFDGISQFFGAVTNHITSNPFHLSNFGEELDIAVIIIVELLETLISFSPNAQIFASQVDQSTSTFINALNSKNPVFGAIIGDSIPKIDYNAFLAVHLPLTVTALDLGFVISNI